MPYCAHSFRLRQKAGVNLDFEILYTSELAAGIQPDCVGQIIRRARVYNAATAITGLLLFDGKRFCQLIEGPEDAVIRLCNRIEADLRHDHFRFHHQGTQQGPRRFAHWAMGYAPDPQRELIEALLASGSGEAIADQRQRRSAPLDLSQAPPCP